MKLRVGLVGLGSAWEVRYRPALRALGDRFDVRAVCDQISLRAEQAARDFGARHVDGFRALARLPDVDAVLLLAPQWYGYLPILAACEEGKSVYCTNTLDLDLDQSRLIRDRVERAGVAFMTEFPRRQMPATLRLKELIATRLGTPRILFCHTRVPAEPPPGAGRTTHVPDGTNDLAELIDWCRYVTGSEPSSVFGIRHRRWDNPAEDDYLMLNLDFTDRGSPAGSGTTAQISCGRYMPAGWQEARAFRPPPALQVACEKGIAFIDLPSTLVWFDTAGRHQESLDSERPVGEQLLGLFYRSVTSLVRNPTTLEDAYRALVVAHQARASHLEGRRIFLEF